MDTPLWLYNLAWYCSDHPLTVLAFVAAGLFLYIGIEGLRLLRRIAERDTTSRPS
jgi:hypothetical protein